jgi:hypothetical protein
VSARYGLACAALTAAVALAPAATASTPASTGASVTYHDRVDDAGLAPDIAAVTVAQTDAGVAVTVALAKPTDLGRYDWIVVGIDTDRNQRTGGMHGSEAVVLVNGERAVLYRLGGRYSPIRARLTNTEVSFTLGSAQLRARTFDFAVATLRQDADVAPDRGVFRYPGSPSAPAPAPPPGAPS